MDSLEKSLYSYRWWAAVVMFFASLVNAMRYAAEPQDFFVVLGLHAFLVKLYFLICRVGPCI